MSINNRKIIIILGVPRSGTTLLRVLLGAHPEITAYSETPWISGGYDSNSLFDLSRHLIESPYGPVSNCGVSPESIYAASRQFVNELILRDDICLLKTPDDLGNLDYLLKLFPDAYYLHITRDGRDVSCSTQSLQTQVLPGFGRKNIRNALRRWCAWDDLVWQKDRENDFEHILHLRYEDLVLETEPKLKEICSFLDVEYSNTMLNYSDADQSLPAWEVGSQDVKRRKSVDPSSIGKWKNQLLPIQMKWIDEEFGVVLQQKGYEQCADLADVHCSNSGYIKCVGKRALLVMKSLVRSLRTLVSKTLRLMLDQWCKTRWDLKEAMKGW